MQHGIFTAPNSHTVALQFDHMAIIFKHTDTSLPTGDYQLPSTFSHSTDISVIDDSAWLLRDTAVQRLQSTALQPYGRSHTAA